MTIPTVPELSGHARTSTHAEVLAFLEELGRTGDPRMWRTSFGRTPEGRELPLVVVADPPVQGPEACRDRVRMLVMANIHAGEVEGKEACLALLRDRGWPQDRVVALFVPIYNADGNDRLGANTRPGQNGPGLTGIRTTASGLDLNRDYLKLEATESRALTALMSAWDPHGVVDLHTTNGSAHGYELTYAPPLHPSTHPAILSLLEEDWLPLLRERMRSRHGFETFDYGNFMSREEEFLEGVDRVGGWRTFDHRPRFGNNCIGLRNRLGLLSEAYAYADFRTRIAATRAFVLEILILAAERGPDAVAACRRADAETAAAGAEGRLRQALSARLASRGQEPLLIQALEHRDGVKVPSGPKQEVQVPCFVRFEAVSERVAPRAYMLPASQEAMAVHLRMHGIRVEVLAGPAEFPVEVHTVKEAGFVDPPFQGHRMRRVAWKVSTASRCFPTGSFRVPMGQPLARFAFQLLDPQAEDGLVAWNAFDPVLEAGIGSEIPVYGLWG
jgi:hypothetical protein